MESRSWLWLHSHKQATLSCADAGYLWTFRMQVLAYGVLRLPSILELGCDPC